MVDLVLVWAVADGKVCELWHPDSVGMVREANEAKTTGTSAGVGSDKADILYKDGSLSGIIRQIIE